LYGQRWESLRNIITAADSVLGKVDKVKYEDWIDAECEHVTAFKNRAYGRLQ
jgi:hypothetical protein